MSVDTFNAEVKKWLAEARDPRWKRPYTELTYLPNPDNVEHTLQAAVVSSSGTVLLESAPVSFYLDRAVRRGR